MIDFHTHSLLSDGDLLLSELIQQASEAGYLAIGITDHVDSGTLEVTLEQTAMSCSDVRPHVPIVPIPGVEITYVPPALIANLATRARELGATLVIVHGETVAELVPPGTNHAALLSNIDILAHPGLITPEDIQLAIDRGIHLEVSIRQGHCLANGHLVRLARELGALHLLVISSDAHSPDDLLTVERQRAVGLGSGLTPEELGGVLENASRLLERIE